MRSLLFTLAMLATFSLHAQTGESAWSYVDYEQYSDYRKLEVLNDSLIVGIGTQGICDQSGFLAVFFIDGRQKWRIDINSCGRLANVDLLIDRAGDILVTGYGIRTGTLYGCSRSGDQDGFYLQKYSPNGDTLINSFYPRGAGVPQITQLPDSNYVWWIGHKAYYIHPSGIIVDSISLPAKKVLDLQVKSDSSLFWLLENQIILTDFYFNQTNEWLPTEKLISSTLERDTIWVMSQNGVYTFSGESLNDPRKDNFPSGFRPLGLSKRIDKNGILFFGNQTGFFEVFVLTEDSYLRPIINPIKGSDVRFALQYQEAYFFSGFQDLEKDAPFREMKNGFVSYLKADSINDYRLQNDVSLNVQSQGFVEPPNPDIDIFLPGTDSLIAQGYRIKFFVDLIIQNHGSDTLKSGYVYSNSVGQFNCTEGRVKMIIDSLNLAPGELRPQQIQYFDLVYKDVNVAVDTYQYCFYVAGPNRQLDGFVDNNEACTSLIITGTKGSHRPNLTHQIRLSPNPATSEVNIRLDGKDPIRSLILLNHAGQQMPASYELNGQDAILQRSQLPPGLYYLRVQTEAGWGVRKLVWQ